MQNIYDRDNPANKFICDREAKALGLKGPVDFIEGEDGCDKRIEEYMKNKANITESSGDKKAFDVCIMNPPYDRNLHLKILEKVIPHCEETINISPIRWLQDPLAKYKKNSDYNKFKESIAEHIKNIKDVNANKLFGTEMTQPCAIYHLDNNKNSYDYENHWKSYKTKFVSKMIERFHKLDLKDTLRGHIENNKLDGIRVPVTTIAGNRGTKPIYKDLAIVVNGKKNGMWWYDCKNMGGYKKPAESPLPKSVKFDNENEAQNFYESYKTTFMSWVCNITVMQQNIQDRLLPFMSDYTHPWTSRRFCDYFNITGYISDTEAEPGSEWEEILNTMEKYK